MTLHHWLEMMIPWLQKWTDSSLPLAWFASLRILVEPSPANEDTTPNVPASEFF